MLALYVWGTRQKAGASSPHIRLEQTPEALHEWVAKMRVRFGGRPLAIGLETSRGPVISAFMAYDFIVLFPINPKALKDYRAAFAVSGARMTAPMPSCSSSLSACIGTGSTPGNPTPN